MCSVCIGIWCSQLCNSRQQAYRVCTAKIHIQNKFFLEPIVIIIIMIYNTHAMCSSSTWPTLFPVSFLRPSIANRFVATALKSTVSETDKIFIRYSFFAYFALLCQDEKKCRFFYDQSKSINEWLMCVCA